jgi:hypothetical protein
MIGKGDCQAIGLPEKHRGQLRGALKRLRERGFVTTHITTQGTIVTLVDQSVFSFAVNSPTTPPTIGEPSTDHRVAIGEPSTDHRVATKNKERRKQRKKEQGKTPPKSPKGEELPHQSMNFESAWNEWEKHRREIKRTLTPSTRSKQFANLRKMTEAKAIDTIERSIAAGWTGLFEDTPESPPSTSNRPRKAPQIGPEGWETAYLAILPGALVPLQWSHVDTTLHTEIQNQIKTQ